MTDKNDQDISLTAEVREQIETLGDPIEGFRIGWAQAMRGETLSEEEFWEAVKDPASSRRGDRGAS